MRARYQVLFSLCIPLFALSGACSDAIGPLTGPSDPAVLQSVTLAPAQATLTTGSHLSVEATSVRANGQPATDSVTWSSSDTKVATVSASGDVMAVAPGKAAITASVGDVSASAPFTIIPAPVESVTVTPAKMDVTVGDSVQFSAHVGKDTAAAAVTWASSNAQVATVSPAGIVTGVAAGTASIRATHSGRTAVAAVSVLVPSPPPTAPTPPDSQSATEPTAAPGAASGLWVHQPAGLATLTNQAWNSLSSLGWNVFNHGYDHVHVVGDPTAPAGDSHVLEFEYPKGYGGEGSGPAVERYQLSANEVYLGFYWKMSPNWQGHPSNINKLLYIFQRRGDARQALVLVAYGPPGGPYHLRLANEPDHSAWMSQNVDNVRLQPGEWHRIEVHLRRSSVDGAPDGLVEWWVDGHLAAHYTNAALRAEPFSEVHIDPVWGGVDATVSKQHDDYFRFGRFYISGR